MAVALATVTAEPANAYPQETNNCNDRTLHWEFQTNSLWTAGGVDRRTWVRAAINTLNDEKSYDGSTLVTVTEDGGIDVQIRDEPASSYGSSECSGGASFWVNSNYSSSKFYYKVGRHEMFHLAGAEHGGDEDSMNSDNPPTMSTCISWTTFRTTNSLDQDSAAYENWLHNGASGRQLHANMGFERNTTYWGKVNGTWSVVTTGGVSGPKNVAFFASGSSYASSYIYQTIRLWTGDDNESYRSRAYVREPISSYSTLAQSKIFRRNMTESGDNGCSYPDGLQNPNSWSIGGYVELAKSSVKSVTTTWSDVTSSYVNPTNTDGLQLQIRIYGKATPSGGGSGSIRIDNARGGGT
ncbi:MAG: hypothetical protein R2823_10815 [Acidimicrobiia bacterium]